MDPDLVRLEGIHALKHCLRFGGEVTSAETSDRAAVLRLAEDVCPDLVDQLANLLVEVAELAPEHGGRTLPSPVVAEAIRPRWTMDDLAERTDRPVVALERPTHLGNLGAVIRVAAAADAAGVITTGSADPWHPGAVRGAAGLQFALPVLSLPDLGPLRRLPGMPRGRGVLGNRGVLSPGEREHRAVIAVDPEGDPGLAVPVGAILVFGSEREGLTPEAKASADAVLALPMRTGVSSLNLATAVAATLYAHCSPTLAP